MTMAGHKSYALLVWAVLVAVTLASWFLTEETHAVRIGSTAVVLIAAFKINAVIGHFMEVRWQPAPWRIVLSVWIAAATTIVLAGYWIPILKG